MIKSRFIFQKMRRKKLYKNGINKFLLTCSEGSSHRNKMFGRVFSVLHISRFEKRIKSSFFFRKMYHDKLYTSCRNKSLLACSDDFSRTQNEKPNVSTTSHRITRKKVVRKLFSVFATGICLYSFRRAFHEASFKRTIRKLSFAQVEIYAKQKVFRTGSAW